MKGFLFLLLIVVIGFLLFAYEAANERWSKMAKVAAMVCKYFGDSEIALFRFPEEYCGEPGFVFAILEYDGEYIYWHDGDWEKMPSGKDRRFFYLASIPDTKKARKHAKEEVDRFRSIMPYTLTRNCADITYSEFSKDIRRFDGSSSVYP